jgi:hypothetical protein
VFKRKQRGKIGLALNGDWYEAKPAADLGEQRRNEKAAERALEFTVGWFARPVYQVGCCFVLYGSSKGRQAAATVQLAGRKHGQHAASPLLLPILLYKVLWQGSDFCPALMCRGNRLLGALCILTAVAPCFPLHYFRDFKATTKA